MKKIGYIAMILALAASMCACRRKEEAKPTQPQPTTPPATVAPTTLPEIDPTLGTNIPDPTVNENSQGMDQPEKDTTISNDKENNDIGTDESMNSLDNAARGRMLRK